LNLSHHPHQERSALAEQEARAEAMQSLLTFGPCRRIGELDDIARAAV
jgi:pyrimidine deaminase RibD-like protein